MQLTIVSTFTGSYHLSCSAFCCRLTQFVFFCSGCCFSSAAHCHVPFYVSFSPLFVGSFALRQHDSAISTIPRSFTSRIYQLGHLHGEEQSVLPNAWSCWLQSLPGGLRLWVKRITHGRTPCKSILLPNMLLLILPNVLIGHCTLPNLNHTVELQPRHLSLLNHCHSGLCKDWEWTAQQQFAISHGNLQSVVKWEKELQTIGNPLTTSGWKNLPLWRQPQQSLWNRSSRAGQYTTSGTWTNTMSGKRLLKLCTMLT